VEQDLSLDRRALLALPAFATLATPAQAQTPVEVIPLWPGKPPGSPAALPIEEITDRVATSKFTDRFVTNVGRPQMEVYRPARPNGAAALVIPGGGYIRVVIDKEGLEIAPRLLDAGVTVFLMRYRLPAEGWAQRSDVALQDVQRAMRLIRANATRLGIDPQRVTAMGFSAGGHVAASVATRHADKVYAPIDDADRLDARPDLSVLMYPVITMALPHAHKGSRTALLGDAPTPEQEVAHSLHRQVNAAVPPTFIVHAADDPSVPVENSLDYIAALRAAKVPCEAHIFEEGGHGFGIRFVRDKPASAWPDLFLTWARRRNFGKPT
jgi:acetyl esterase/lipase